MRSFQISFVSFLKKRALLTFIGVVSFILCLCSIDYWSFAVGKRFHPNNVYASWSFEKGSSHSLLLEEDYKKIFSQKFSYLGEGRQCFAFQSEDEKFVIKFFKARHLRSKKWMEDGLIATCLNNILEKDFYTKRAEIWEKELHETADRYRIAFEKIPRETGILYLHFSQTDDLKKKILLCSKEKKEYEISLDDVPFILQQKATPTKDYISSLLISGKRNEAKKAIVELRDFLVHRTKQGITDERQSYGVNFGFIKERAVQIDIGKITLQEDLKQSPHFEIYRLEQNLQRWVRKNYPEIAEEVEKDFFFSNQE